MPILLANELLVVSVGVLDPSAKTLPELQTSLIQADTPFIAEVKCYLHLVGLVWLPFLCIHLSQGIPLIIYEGIFL